jgi:hypothetical protein
MYSSEYTSGFSWPAASHWPHLLRLVTKAMSDRLLELRERPAGQARWMKVDLVHLVCLVQPNKRDRPDKQERPAILALHAPILGEKTI